MSTPARTQAASYCAMVFSKCAILILQPSICACSAPVDEMALQTRSDMLRSLARHLLIMSKETDPSGTDIETIVRAIISAPKVKPGGVYQSRLFDIVGISRECSPIHTLKALPNGYLVNHTIALCF